MKILDKLNSELKDIETKKLIPVEKEIEIQENPLLFEHQIKDKTAEEFFEEEKKEEEKKKEEVGINIAELEELLRYILIVFHAWLFERKFKKKKPEGFEETVLPLYLKILQKYNLMITEELALIGIYVFAIYTAEPLEESSEKREEKEKKEEKKENNLLKELEKLENE